MKLQGYGAKPYVTNSGLINVSGENEKGHSFSFYLTYEEVEKLRLIFKYAEENQVLLGHAQWHIMENRFEKCSCMGLTHPA